MSTAGWGLLGLGAALLVIAGAAWAASARKADSVSVAHGPFEVLAWGRRISSGAFPNTSANPFGTMEVTGFGVNFGGQPVTVPVHGGPPLQQFWRVLRLMDAQQPALLVSTTDFHLITEEQGRVVVRALGEPSTDLAQLQWLDAAPGHQPAPVRHFGIEKVDPDADTALRGGRWLRIAYHTVLDVQTLKSYPVRPWVDDGPGKGLNASVGTAVAMSPGQTQYVSVGEGREDNGRGFTGLVVVDIASGDAYGLRLSRRKTRYAESSDIDAAWLAHYFSWKRDAQGRERLLPNGQARPLPWRGKVIEFSSGPNYRWQPVRPGLRAELKRFLIERQGAQVAPDWLDPTLTRGDTFRLPGCGHVIAISQHEDELGLHAPPRANGGLQDPDCQAAVRRLGQAFDAELASGRLDALFIDEVH
ncbi:MAG: hypothetical protein HY021_02490 [Burkholderiales bacterium]|nr:hypothetical protein [Burkholderiales bacterium]